MIGTVALAPAMPTRGAPSWPGARWVGLLDLPLDPALEALALTGADGYGWARLLVRSDGVVRGVVEAPIVAGAVCARELRLGVEALPRLGTPAPAAALPPISVVVCTRDRAADLAEALASLCRLDYPDFEIVVVDNAPSTTATADVVATLDDPRVRLVTEPRPGLSRARNQGVRAARHAVVAFTDDDVVADAQWLRGIAGGFARAGDVACVTGLVPAGELRTATQAAFERRVGWADAVRDRVFRLAEPPRDIPLFPFRVAAYGTGANFAARRDAILALGGFDEALGAGSPTRGGEDVDFFVRVLLAGHALAVEPAALTWHRHRAEPDALREQAVGYGSGLGAWLFKIFRDRRTRRPALRRALGGARRLAQLSAGGSSDTDAVSEPDVAAALARAARAERAAVLRGALRYGRAARAARADTGAQP